MSTQSLISNHQSPRPNLYHPLLVLCTLCLILTTSCSNPTPNTQQSTTKPNILFIAVDDLRPDLGCYGNTFVKSPNIDRLAERGMVFNRAYCQVPICMASRASIMSGYRPDHGQLYTNGPLFELIPDALSINQHFKNNGYTTVGLGKIYGRPSDVEDSNGWSKDYYDPQEGAWTGRGYLNEDNVKLVTHFDSLDKQRNRGRGPAFEAADVPDSLYKDGMILKQAVRELNQLKDSTFFLAVGFQKPHLPFCAPKKYWDLYDPNEIELAANPFFPEGAPEISFTQWKELRNYHGIPKEGPMPDSLARVLKHGYYASSSYIDALVGELLNELEKLELADNTIIVLWSDHGWKLGEHSMWSKHTTFELDARTTLLLSAPEMKEKGKRTDALTELVDVYPTLCELAGIDLPDHLEGTSMVPLLENANKPWKKAAFSQFPNPDISWQRHVRKPYTHVKMGYSMRTERYRYTEWINLDTKKVEARQLYDLEADPDENKNIAEQPENEQLVESLSQQLHAGYKEAKPVLQ